LRITDRSPASFFTESSDGFDVDGIEALHTACSTPSMSNRESNTEVTVDEKAVNAHMWPNPFKEHLNVLLTEGSAGQNIQLNIFNFVGQPVYQKEMQIKYGDESLLQIETNHLNPGIYMVNIKSAGFENSYRVVKTR
jgi:hypothetical protein